MNNQQAINTLQDAIDDMSGSQHEAQLAMVHIVRRLRAMERHIRHLVDNDEFDFDAAYRESEE